MSPLPLPATGRSGPRAQDPLPGGLRAHEATRGNLLSMDGASAGELAGLFDALASPTRLRLLQALLLLGDPCMSDLAGAVGMKPQAVSNQLRKLVDWGILATRRHGSHAHYRIVDPGVAELMGLGLRLMEEARRPLPGEAP